MGALEISLLGGFQLRRDGASLPPIPSRTARSLMAYLVLNRDRAHTRDLLIGTFWPDMAESRGRRRLSHALWQIRSTVGDDDCLITPGDSVRFDSDTDFWLDVDEFEWTIEQAAPGSSDRRTESELLEHAVRLYRGDLLAGFYDDWVFPDQDRLRARFLSALDRLADLAMARGDYDTALEMARRTTQHAPLREEAHRRVMRIAVLLGRHSDAIRQFERCRSILASDLGTEPSPETLDLYQEILDDRETGTAHKVASPHAPLFDRDEPTPLVGRERERATLAGLLDGVLDGRGAVALIEGESGVGKTRMLAEAAEDARWRGMTVVWGGSAPSGGLPYGPIAEALGTGLGSLHGKRLAGQLDPIWRDQLAPLVPGLGEGGRTTEVPLGRAEERERMLEAVALAFEGLARLNPTFVVLEDVHWADDETIAALLHLSARVADHAILLAVSYRHGEARERSEIWDLLRTIDRHAHSDRISLAPCSPAQTEELIRRSLGVPEVAAEFSERVHRETGGIPLFVLETLRALAEGDDLGEDTGSSADRGGLPITPTVHRLIQTRLEGLSPPIHDTLSLISVHDGLLHLGEIVDASEAEEMAVLEAVDDLVSRRLVTERDGGFRVGHELMRRVVYDDLPLSRRLDFHRRVALAIETHRPGDVEVLAHHFTTARMPDRAADYLERAAGHALAVHAYDTAAFHLVRAAEALEEIDADADRRYSVAALREGILDTLARREEQDRALEEMERFATPDGRSDVHRRRASWLAHLDRFAEAEEEAATAVALARDGGDGSRLQAALTTRGMIACWAGRAAEGVAYLEEAAGFKSADLRQQADTRNTLGHNLIDLQRFDEAEPQLLAALALYGEVGDARGQADVLGMLATLRMERGEPEAAAHDYGRAIEISHSIGWRSGEAVYHLNLGILEAIRGRMGAARDAFEAASHIYAGMDNQRGRALVLSNASWLNHAYLGDDEKAERQSLEALDLYEEMREIRGKSQSCATLGSIAGRQGDITEARRQLQHAIELAREAEDSWLTAQILRQLADVEITAECPGTALPLTEEAISICAESGMEDLAVGIRAVHGTALLRSGRLAAADEITSSAIEDLRPGIDQGYLVAAARSEVLRARGDSAGADHFLRMACEGLLEMLSGLSDAERDLALSAVPQHRAIVDAWEARRPRIETAHIAAVGAPSGRGLADDEYVEVQWTVSAPADEDIADRILRRRHRLLRLCEEAAAQGGAPTVEDLATALGASPATVRRDLAALRKSGHRAETRGSRAAHTD